MALEAEARTQVVAATPKQSWFDFLSSVGETGPGDDLSLELHPWVETRRKRSDLRIRLPGVTPKRKKVYWHDAVWFFFQNRCTFNCWDDFAASLQHKQGSRVDHVGGNPAVVSVGTLRLGPKKKSDEQGGALRATYDKDRSGRRGTYHLCAHALVTAGSLLMRTHVRKPGKTKKPTFPSTSTAAVSPHVSSPSA